MLGARLNNWHEMRTEVFGGTLMNSEFRSILIIIEPTAVEGSETWIVHQAEALVVTLMLGRMRPFESDRTETMERLSHNSTCSQLNLDAEGNKHKLVAQFIHSCRNNHRWSDLGVPRSGFVEHTDPMLQPG